jgi:fatty-acyl-CoA synthase
MVALVVDDRFDISALRAQIESRLPAYARPLFLRVSNRIEMTDTFRHKKRSLSDQGYDFRNFDEAVYFAAPQSQNYQLMDLALLEELSANAIKL